jgi:hypothetical protein
MAGATNRIVATSRIIQRSMRIVPSKRAPFTAAQQWTRNGSSDGEEGECLFLSWIAREEIGQLRIRSLDHRLRRTYLRLCNLSGDHKSGEKANSGRKEYSKDDVKLLKAHSKARTPVAKLSKLMKRSEGSLRQKARMLGIGLSHQR